MFMSERGQAVSTTEGEKAKINARDTAEAAEPAETEEGEEHDVTACTPASCQLVATRGVTSALHLAGCGTEAPSLAVSRVPHS